MFEITLMNPSKTTDNKLRWVAGVNGTPFQLYIPKWRVPEPWPVQVVVTVTANLCEDRVRIRRDPDRLSPITAIIEKVKNHTRTVRYRPLGDKDEWEIGEPYVPYEILESLTPEPLPEKLQIEVRWDYSAGTWSDE